MDIEYSYDLTAEETALSAPSDQALRVPYFCEENVWRLAYRKRHEFPNDRFWAVFISNSIKNVPMFQQRASPDPEMSVCWDYHVILLTARAAAGAPQHSDFLVYDMDSHLPYPCPLKDYLRHSFPYEGPPPMAPLFRVIDADLFLLYFSSDRMHMYNERNGSWKASPPPYAPIQSRESSASNIDHYLNFVQRPIFTEIEPRAFGTILTQREFMAAVGNRSLFTI